MNKNFLVLILITPFFAWSQGAEVATFMEYNLLNYRNETTYCTNTNNNPITKEGYLKTIFKYVSPDLFTCNEIGSNPSNALKILDRCINVDGENRYEMANFNSNSSLANALFYNGEMFGLLSKEVITNDANGAQIVRLIDVFKLYYKENSLSQGADTTFLTIFVAHFKAGNTSSDRTDRGLAAEAVMDYIENKPVTGNYIISGDFNTYTSSEAAIQELIFNSNSSIAFIDPVNKLGNWNNNSNYAEVHTQSTHYSSNGCASGGGLDDRFDFILISDAIKNNIDHIDYVNNSYKALANDGNHFNQSINNPANTSVPASVLDAIYEMSDHLPVILDMIITESTPNGVVPVLNENSLKLVNPSVNGITGTVSGNGNYSIEVFNAVGQLLYEDQLQVNEFLEFRLDVSLKGFAMVRFTNQSGTSIVKKVILK